MSTRTRKKTKRSTKAKSKKTLDNSIDFDSWFWLKVKESRLRDVQKKEVKVFFNQKGLKDRESKDKYEETLKLY